MNRTLVVCAVLLAGAGAFAMEKPGLPIEVTAREPAGVAWKSAPICGGIPLPWGVYKNDQGFALFAGDQEVPSQTLPLVVDEKGYLRWILLDYQVDLAPNESKTFTLKAVDPKARPPSPLKVSETDKGVTVETGAMTFTIAKDKPFSLFSSVSVGGKPVVAGGEVSYTDITKDNPVRHVADKPASIVVDYRGPMRTTIIVRAPFQDDEKTKLMAIARITAWAGRSDVHVKYSLANSNKEHYTYRMIQDSSITLTLAGKPAKTLIGATEPQTLDGGASVTRGARSMAGRRKPREGHTKVEQAGKSAWQADGRKEKCHGWIAAQTGSGAVFACDRYFNADPPRRMSTEGGALTLSGVIPRFDGPGGPAHMYAKHRWAMDCSHLDSQYVIDLAAPAEMKTLDARAEAARYPLHAMAPPAWYFETEGLSVGKFGTQEDELAAYDTWEWKYDKNRAPKSCRDNRRYVWGEDNHYELEEDVVESILLMYLRTGGRDFYNTAEAWANYGMALRQWRTDDWRWRDGGVWWTGGGPVGNRPTRLKDPVTGRRNGCPAQWAKTPEMKSLGYLANAKQCYCHNWGAGLCGWFCITGDRDAYEAALDSVDQNFDTQARAFRKRPGKTWNVSRPFTRSCRLTNAARLIAPNDEFVKQASDFLAAVWLQRPIKEPRGLVTPAVRKLDMLKFEYEKYVGEQGMKKLREEGVIIDQQNGALTDFATGARWHPIIYPHQWMYPPLSRAFECYYRLTGDEDALDWMIAYGQGVAYLFHQDDHYVIHRMFMIDFPKKGVHRDYASWTAPDNKRSKGIKISGYLQRFHPDIPARAYQYTGEELLRKRAYWLWNGGSHRRYQATDMSRLGRVGMWVNYYGPHSEEVGFTGKTFYVWAHPKKDKEPPEPVQDLAVEIDGKKATVTFTSPADQGGGAVVRYQVKCSDKPLVSFQDFLKAWKENKDSKVTNWWMGVNLDGEPTPVKPGEKVSFTVTGLPEYEPKPKYFAVRTFDDSSNRSLVSNVARPE